MPGEPGSHMDQQFCADISNIRRDLSRIANVHEAWWAWFREKEGVFRPAPEGHHVIGEKEVRLWLHDYPESIQTQVVHLLIPTPPKEEIVDEV